MASIVIIGAGLTGISAAYHLEQAGCYDYVILEKEQAIGGLCRSIQHNGFTFDYTGHLLHLNNDHVRSLVERVVGFDTLNTITRASYIYSHNRYTKYPYQINLNGLPADVIVECIEGFVNKPPSEHEPTMFIDWVMAHFGAGFAKHFFFPYQKKIFSVPVEELSASWTGRFVPSTSLREMLYGALHTPADEIGYNAQFFYPKSGGIIRWVEPLYNTLHHQALLTHEVTHINTHNQVVSCSNGVQFPYKHIISTMPLDHLIDRITERSNSTLYQARPHLRCNSILNINLGIQRQNLVAAHWVYYPEEQYPFYRIGFPSQLSNQMTPAGYSSLSGEYSFLPQSNTNMNLLHTTLRTAITSLFQLDPAEVCAEVLTTIPHAYVIFDRWRDIHLNVLLQQLTAYHIHSTGRYGGWKYGSMQEAVLDGKQAAEAALAAMQDT